ncbi:MAG TPA: crotonase/enoyl-CoA hydratase family protein [Patescibacteria group bacterium]|nr:crotonase/enoyl-CoA hydratase family protein [Patescibacteria group bacterium]
MNLDVQTEGAVMTVTITRPEVRNAVDPPTARELADAFREFDNNARLSVAVLTGAGGSFCAGFDLKAVAAGAVNRISDTGDAPMGPTRMALSKPVIAAVEGHAVAGGLELALWCDLRVAGRDAVFGVFNRRFGVPLIDLGTIRLPRLVGQGRALDLILTGRPVGAEEALRIGLVDRLVDSGSALTEARNLASAIASFPQPALRADRLSVFGQWALDQEAAMRAELAGGLEVMASGESVEGARRFAAGSGRHGRKD